MAQRRDDFDWTKAKAFLYAAELGSLSAAARQLGLTQSTISRQVAAFEESLGLVLFERVGTGLKPTSAGLELVDHIRSMRDAADQVALSASGQVQSIEGTVRLSTNELFAFFVMPDIIKQIRQKAPALVVELVASDAISNLRQREADIALRSAAPADPSLIATRLDDIPWAIYGTKDHIARHGHVTKISDIARYAFVGFEDNQNFISQMNVLGCNLTQENFVAHSNSSLVYCAMIKAGLGIGPVPCRIGDQEPALEPVFSAPSKMTAPLWLVAHRELRTSRKIRLVFDVLKATLSGTSA